MTSLSNQRSVINRNRTGGFVGAAVGILLFGLWIQSWILSGIAAVIGFLLGYYFEELITAAKHSWSRAVMRTKARYRLYMRMPRKFRSFLHERAKQIGPPPVWGHIKSLVMIPIHWLSGREPRVTGTRFLAAVTYFGLFALGAYLSPLNVKLAEKAGTGPDPSILVLPAFLGICGYIVAVFMPPILAWKEGFSAKRLWAKDYHRGRESGGLYLYALSVLRLIRAHAFLLLTVGVMLVYGLSYFIVAGGVYIMFALVPVLAFVGIIRAAVNLATRWRHAVGATVTVVVMWASAWLFSPHFHSVAVVWSVALGAATVAGIAAGEAARTFAALYESSERLQALSERSIGEYLAPANILFSRFTGSIVSLMEPAGKRLSRVLLP